MNTSGELSFAPYVHGDFNKHEVQPGYRTDFDLVVDFFDWKGFISNWNISSTTMIEQEEGESLELDRIRYTLTPGYRMEFEKYLISGLLLHECIHTISKPEENGAVWWNSFQFGFGSNGAYQKFLVKRYTEAKNAKFPDFDFNVNVGAFLYGDHSIWIKQNHEYRYEAFYKLRFHLNKIGPWGFFIDFDHHSWAYENFSHENKMSIDFNIFLSGNQSIASIFYRYYLHDTFAKDNQDQLGLIGFKVVF